MQRHSRKLAGPEQRDHVEPEVKEERKARVSWAMVGILDFILLQGEATEGHMGVTWLMLLESITLTAV